jgi:hypothetical protein
MASDTVAKTVVEELFPADWLLAMKACRSTHWRMGKQSGVYSKFSSMGNGYTFEMETVLFVSAARAVCTYLGLPWWEVSAFGDDLTIGVEGVELLTSALSSLGFTVNASKSFWTGVFRESCGKDFFLGANVRPYFVRSLLRDVHDVRKFHNGVLRTYIPMPKTAKRALRSVHVELRTFGPQSLGDTVFYSATPKGDFKLASSKFPMFEGYLVRHWVFKPKKVQVKFFEPAVLASLYSNGEKRPSKLEHLSQGATPTLGFSTLRERGNWKIKTALVPGWD